MTKAGLFMLLLFILTLDGTEEMKDVYVYEHLCHLKVEIEVLRVSELIARFRKCQRYGQQQNYYRRMPISVRDAGNHQTVKSKKLMNTPARCSNCSQSHQTNYRGCIVSQELRKCSESLDKYMGVYIQTGSIRNILLKYDKKTSRMKKHLLRNTRRVKTQQCKK